MTSEALALAMLEGVTYERAASDAIGALAATLAERGGAVWEIELELREFCILLLAYGIERGYDVRPTSNLIVGILAGANPEIPD